MKADNAFGMKIVVMAIVLSIVTFIFGLVIGYFRDTFVQPAGSTRSVPPPRFY